MPAPDYATEIAALQAGLASGEARIESDGDVIWYRSVGDITKAISYFTQLAASAAAAGRPVSASTVAAYESE